MNTGGELESDWPVVGKAEEIGVNGLVAVDVKGLGKELLVSPAYLD